MSTLVLGWGNPGRQDDGLGPALVAELAGAAPPGVTLSSDYQLQVEDAADVARHQRVIFVDADRSAGVEPFWIRRLVPASDGAGFTTHSLAPDQVLALSRQLFGRQPEAWLLGIRGRDFDEFGEGLSSPARANLACAAAFVRDLLAADAGIAPEDATRPADPTSRTRG